MDINNSLDVHLRRLRTTNIPTILVEGKDDFLLLDWILAKSNANTSNILVCGGSLMLHKIFETVNQNPEQYPLVKLFLADQDMYVFTGIPKKYENVFFTKGYSIENDLFYDSEQYINNLLVYPEMLEKKLIALKNIAIWFAFEVEDYLKQTSGTTKITEFSKCNLRNDTIFSAKTLSFTQKFLTERKFYAPSDAIKKDLEENYALKLRGHTLIQAITLLFHLPQTLSRTTFETVEHGKEKTNKAHNPKYSDEQLMHMCFAYSVELPNSLLNRIITKITASLQ